MPLRESDSNYNPKDPRSIINETAYANLLGTENIDELEAHLREGIINPLSKGDQQTFIDSAQSEKGRLARSALFSQETVTTSKIRQRITDAIGQTKLISFLEEQAIPTLNAYAQQSREERLRRDSEKPTVEKNLKVLWESPYLDKAYVESLQDQFDEYYLTPEEAETKKNHIPAKMVNALTHFMMDVKFDGDNLLLSDEERKTLLGVKLPEDTYTSYGTLSQMIGLIETPGKFQGKYMHSGQLKMALTYYANKLFSFMKDDNNFPKGKTERALWESVRSYVDSTDEDTNEEILIKFHTKIATAFKRKEEKVEEELPSPLILPIAPGQFEPLLIELARQSNVEAENIMQRRIQKKAITVDTEEAKLFEDAFWVKKLSERRFRLEISTGDAASLLAGKPELIEEAIKRRYKQLGVPIFPDEFAYGNLNMAAGMTHPTITFTIDFNKEFFEDGVDPNLNLELTTIYITNNLTYAMGDLPYMENTQKGRVLQQARTIADTLARKRHEHGEYIHSIDNKYFLDRTSERIVAEFMVLISRLIGQYMTQEPMTTALHLQNALTFKNTRYSRYTLDPTQSVNKKGFIRVTEPLRRAADTINQIILLSKVFGKGEAYTQDELQEICDYLNEPYDVIIANQ